MLYHYTSIPAMESILKDAVTRGTMCFWATRYDCFVDEEEYQLGVMVSLLLLRAVNTRPEYHEQVKDAIQRLVPGEIPVRVINP